MRSSLVVIPTFNEAKSIGDILDALKDLDADVLVIDDGSPDGTAEVVRLHKVEVVQRESKQGLGNAYRTGFSIGIARGYTYIIQMDADGSHQVSDLINMMEWIGSSDLLIGSRWIQDGSISNWSKAREYLSRTANRYANVMLGLKVKDSTSGLRIYESALLKKMNLSTIKSEGYCFQIEMTRKVFHLNGRVREVPITFIEREFGVSKMNMRIIIEAMLRVTLWGIKPKK
jgi:dolichol-phosphate mannosyltransferase